MKKLFANILFAFLLFSNVYAQEYFTINQYHVSVKVNRDASLDITEIISAYFTEPRHGIIRRIPYKYQLQNLPGGSETAERQMVSKGHLRTIVENIKVAGWDYSVNTAGDYKEIKIGSKDTYLEGNQQFIISYRILNAINFFKDHSELYYNIIGDQWATSIDSVDFSVELYTALPGTTSYFVATGNYGSKENNTATYWNGNKIFSGHTTSSLKNNEGLTVGIRFPEGFLIKPDYRFRGILWLILPFIVFTLMLLTWRKWGKDEKVTVMTEFYPPENISPSVSGYIIDDKLDRRDLTALVPYWGAGGYLKINETENKSLFCLIKNKEYEFIKLRELPESAMSFEKTLFNGIFKTGEEVKLTDLKNVLYTTMNNAKAKLESEINKDDFYVKYTRGLGYVFPVIGLIILGYGLLQLITDWPQNLWKGIACISSGLIIIVFGVLMAKKTKKGTLLYQKLLGFKEFIKSVEKDRLQEFLKQDEHYFDKVLPYAIVFDMADKWKDKLKGLDVPPPSWYSGSYAGGHFNTMMFMNSLDHSMNAMSENFYSSPHSSGSSGGSFGGGGGFSGGGFGGGGGSSW
jgi:uncharacterized membrane protein